MSNHANSDAKGKRAKLTMDLLFTLLLTLTLAACLWIFGIPKPSSGRWPPGPTPIPIIGNILELGEKPHQSLANLSKIYGPLMTLKLGAVTSIIVSSKETAKIVLRKHDQSFASRSTLDAVRALDHHKFSVAWMPADTQWRKLRKICKENIFSVQKLEASHGLRMEKLQNLFDYVIECSKKSQAVDIGRAAFTTSLNLISATLFSVDFAAFGSDSSQELRDIVSGIMEIIGQPNFADYFPVFQMVDPQGILKKATIYVKKLFGKFDDIIRERIQSRTEGGEYKPKNDLLEVLLDIREKNEFELSFDDIKHLLLDLLVAGSDTTSGTVEWAMAELIRNPDKLLKVRNEIKDILGQNQQVQESDISKLPYLRAVVKETFRLHPVVPLSVPHKSIEDMEVNGYFIPKNTRVLVNVWAIGRDSNTWSKPNLFMPERFLEQEIDFRGQHFELIPFGGGRRICVGLPLAYRMLHLMVATMINNVDWKLEQGLKCEELNMSERFRFSLHKVVPLTAIPVKLSY